MDYAALKAELTADPLARGYAGMTAAQATASLNAVDRPGPVPVGEVTRYLRAGGKMAEIERVARFGDVQAEKVRAALALAGALADFDSFDLQNATFKAAIVRDLDAAVAHGMLSAADKATLLGLESNRRSRAQELGLGVVHLGEVEYARSDG